MGWRHERRRVREPQHRRHRERQRLSRRSPGAAHPLRLPAADAASDGDASRLRARGLRRLHGARRRPRHALLPDAGGPSGRPPGDDHRGARRPGWKLASAPGRVLPPPRPSMRILHAGPSHHPRRIPEGLPRSDRGRDPRGDLRKHLPLHRLRQHRRSDDRSGARAARRRDDAVTVGGFPQARVLGRDVPRVEDEPLIRGKGRFLDDIALPDMLHAAFLRSPHAHALIRGIDAAAARALPGVAAILTLADLLPCLAETRLKTAMPSPSYRQQLDRPVLADREAVHVGEPIAIALAESRALAEDAAAAVEIDYDPLPVVADCLAALEAGAATAHRGAPSNLVAEMTMGFGDVDRAFEQAPHRFRERLRIHRGGSHSMECRGVVAVPEPVEDRLTVWSSTQMPHAARRLLCDILGLDENRIRVATPDIGGAFGPKLVFYPEEVAVAAAARATGRPVKWVEDRREHFVATAQERDQYWDVELATDADGRILAVRGALVHDHGAWTVRGVNVPQGVFAMERLLDAAARGLGLDRAEIRRRNLVPPDRMPYATPLKTRGGIAVTLDSGDYPRCQQMALDGADWSGFPARQAAARAKGRYLGIGLANYVEGTGRGPYEHV